MSNKYNSKTQKEELINLILSFDEPLANLNSFNLIFNQKMHQKRLVE